MGACTRAFEDNLYSRLHDSPSARFRSEDQEGSSWDLFEELNLLIIHSSVDLDFEGRAVFSWLVEY